MRKDMNFFSQFEGKRNGKSSSDIYVYLACGIVSAIIIGTVLWNSILIFITNRSIKDYEAKLNTTEVQDKIQESDKANSQIDSLTKYDSVISIIYNGVETHNVVTTKLLNQISSTLPTEVYLIKVDINNNEINLQGKSKNKVAIAEFEQNLTKLDSVESAFVKNIAGEQEFTFDLKCILKDVE